MEYIDFFLCVNQIHLKYSQTNTILLYLYITHYTCYLSYYTTHHLRTHFLSSWISCISYNLSLPRSYISRFDPPNQIHLLALQNIPSKNCVHYTYSLLPRKTSHLLGFWIGEGNHLLSTHIGSYPLSLFPLLHTAFHIYRSPFLSRLLPCWWEIRCHVSTQNVLDTIQSLHMHNYI